MKKVLQHFFGKISALVIFLCAFTYTGMSQITMSTANCTISANEVQMDLLVTNNSAADLRWNSTALRMTVPASMIPAGAQTYTFNYLGGSDFPLSWPAVFPGPAAGASYTAATHLLTWTTGTAGAYNNLSCTAPLIGPGETKTIGRFSFKITSTNFIPGANADFVWQTTSSCNLYQVCAGAVTGYNQASGLRTLATPCSLTVCSSPTVNNSPSDQTICTTGTATFTGSFTGGTPAPTLVWQEQIGGTGPFTNLTETIPYSGTTTNTLSITTPNISLSTNRYRLKANNTCGDVFTGDALLTISPNVNAGTVTGTSPLCIGATTTYTSDGDAGGSWSSSAPLVATVDGTGLVTGVSAGTADITYTVNTGCGSPVFSFATVTISPNANAGTVTGTSPLCIGATATYTSDGDAGGSWSSSAPLVATVDGAGLVTGIGPGTSTIIYTINSGCGSPLSASQDVTVQAIDYANLQFPPSGTICPGGSLTAYGQVYEPGITDADQNGQGVGIDVEFGFSNMNDNSNPALWTNWAAATYNASSICYPCNNDEYQATAGSLLTPGTYYYTFRYRLSGCSNWQYGGYPNGFWNGTDQVSGVLTVSPNANAGTVTGSSPLCIGATATYTSDGDAGGSWSSSAPLVATVDGAGLVTGVSAGTADITYTVNTGCGSPVFSFATVTISPNANAGTVTGSSPLCIGATATYTSDGDAGGSWSSSAPLVATVDGAGLVTGVSAGTADITYTVNTGCGSPVFSFATVTISPNANAGTVTGTSPLCIGATTTYTSDGDAGGSWSSSAPLVATVDGAGLVTGVSAGTADITYTVNTGCGSPVFSFATVTISPNANAGTVTGTSPLCIGATATYTSDGDAGGSWSSSAPLVATVDGAGLVTGVSAGTADITYTVNTGCGNPVFSFATVTISPNANAGTVTGSSPLCIGATATYTSDGDAGGSWSSSAPLVATVDGAGLVTGVSAGTADITYTVNTGCGSPVFSFATVTISPNANAGTVTGTSPLCIGATTTYTSDGDAGGSWSSSAPLVATVDGAGLVTGVSAGTADITYTVNTGCGSPVFSFATVTISPNANAGTVTGTSPLCIGATATYTSDGDAGGSWSSSAPLVATVDGAGLVTGVSAGTADITYTVNTGCGSPVFSFATVTISPNANAGTVTGTSPLCIGATTTYTSDGDAGGSWSSSAPLVATVDGAGLVTGVSAGTADITYTVNTGCGSPVFSFATVTISPNANAGTVTGSSPLCIGATATYTSDGDAGGSWSSSAPLVATVDGAGLVTGVSAGTADITYTVNTGCGSPVSSFATVTISPNANAGTVTGASGLCAGNTTTYTSDGDAGGTWSSTNPSVATVDAAGLVTTIGAGTADITYTVNTGCGSPLSSFQTITVNPFTTTLAGTTGGSQVCHTSGVQPAGTSYSDGSCNLIATILPSGAVPVSGNIDACVIIDGSVSFYLGRPYVQRHYDITPSNDPVNATATVTLYFTQQEFDAYNLVRGVNPPLPVDNLDVSDIPNVLLTQFHGTGSAPGNYSGSDALINPDDDKIVWDNILNAWKITFDVNGFSGFYLHTSINNTTIPIGLLSFSGRNNGNYNLLEWATSSEQNSSYFDLLRSSDGTNFAKVGSINAAGNSSTTRNYSYNDNIAGLGNDLYYYKLKMVELGGLTKYSTIVKIRLNTKGFNVEASPNPFFDQLRVNIETPLQENAIISLKDISGKRIQQKETLLRKGSNAIPFYSLNSIPAGVYLLTVTTDSQQQTVKVVKQ